MRQRRQSSGCRRGREVRDQKPAVLAVEEAEYLKGIGVGVTTYNFGSADSIATILFCAGSQRICVPHARFLIHAVTMQLPGAMNFKEKDMEEMAKSANIDAHNISKIISDATGKPQTAVETDMQNRTTLNAIQAKDYGLATSIGGELYSGGKMFAIYETGEVFSYVPTPEVTAGNTFVPPTLYNIPQPNNPSPV